MYQAVVIGHPIKHSKSPLLHGYWLKKYGIEGGYQALEVAPEDLKSFVNRLRQGEYVGSNVTIPHKQAVLEYVDVIDACAQRIGAANTLWVEDGKVYATNSDGFGFLAHLLEHVPNLSQKHHHALVIGAGGAARAVVDTLAEQGIKNITIINRSIEKAEALCNYFARFWPKIHFTFDAFEASHKYLFEATLVVNTTSLGMVHQPRLNIDLYPLKPQSVVYDLVYTPLETELLKQARARGLMGIDGLGMLLHQGRPGFQKWFGIMPEVDAPLKKLMLS